MCWLAATIALVAPITRIDKTVEFDTWLKKLKDSQAKGVIMVHIGRIAAGNIGKTRNVGEGVWEKKINYGPGYRLYYCNCKQRWILLLCGGSKSTQSTDIVQAKKIKKGL